jgi:hypothetical protein
MDLFTVIRNYADHIGGTFTDYDHEKGIVVVPLKESRFQTVLAATDKSKVSGRKRVFFTSKVSDSTDGFDAKDLLTQNGNFDYSKFIIEDGQLKVVASCLVDSTTEDEVKFMLQEVAQLADQYEFRLTGKDVY